MGQAGVTRELAVFVTYYPESRPRYNDSLPEGAIGVDVRGRFCRDRCVKVSLTSEERIGIDGSFFSLSPSPFFLPYLTFSIVVVRLPARRVHDPGGARGRGGN